MCLTCPACWGRHDAVDLACGPGDRTFDGKIHRFNNTQRRHLTWLRKSHPNTFKTTKQHQQLLSLKSCCLSFCFAQQNAGRGVIARAASGE
ncbi:hypothetical protein pipiens_002932 [Culex pipiens pipiens]|uniref:Uncharacterized protein n=1 Tax=Culex pipiens pipiens TaxID=38569 RepID=A0ABD1D5Z0_CULPP